jgi:transcriptional regulator EpsA
LSLSKYKIVVIIKSRRTIISTQFNSNVQINNNDGLSLEQRVNFMDVISGSLRITQRSHLFNWLQGEFQSLVGHEIMIFGVKSTENEPYYFEYFTSSRYFSDAQFNEVIQQETGLISQVLKLWRKTSLPLFVNNQDEPMQQGNYNVINFDQNSLVNSELKNFVIHGFGQNHSKLSSIVIFARLHKQANTAYAHMLELIMPHLHCALIRVTSSKNNFSASPDNLGRLITKRESEVLQWLHMGKTNWEISTILDISPLTVKNHVQNVIRKLSVLNRSQAAVKAAKLGLIKILK